MGKKSGKGSAYERALCKRLSMWWTDGKRDDVFWRTSGSGARATVRWSHGKRTAGHYGDVGAVDEIGIPLVSLITIEVKRGYRESHFGFAFDAEPHAAQKPWEAFVQQARDSARQAGTPHWLLVHKRDRAQALVFMPVALARALVLTQVCPALVMRSRLRLHDVRRQVVVFSTSLDALLANVTPNQIKRLYENEQQGQSK